MNLYDYLSAHPVWALAYLSIICVATGVTLRFTLPRLALYYAWSKKPVQESDFDDVDEDDVVKDLDE
jgi:hypothetical protein